MSLRDYQHKAIADIEARTGRRVLLVAPTGSGKTVIGAEIVRRIEVAGGRVLFLVHRHELIGQSCAKLGDAGMTAGVIAAGFAGDPDRAIQVASVQTLHTRRHRLALPELALLVIDEAHHATAQSWRAIIDRCPGVPVVGMTATPIRRNGSGLGDIFETIVETPQIRELIRLGHLVGTRVYGTPEGPDLRGVRTKAGDYVETQLAARVDRQHLVGDIVAEWKRHAAGLATICFAVNVAHSQHLAAAFCAAGVTAEHLDGDTPAGERRAILARLASGQTAVVCNCNILCEGFDLPDLGAVILARPTKSFGLYRQQVGRGLRPAPGKRHLIVLDHGGCTGRHGFVEWSVAWSLDPTERADRDPMRGRELRRCPGCGALGLSGRLCPCGWRPPPPVVVEQPLRRLEADQLTPRVAYRQLKGYAAERGYSPGWAFPAFTEWSRGTQPPYSWRYDEPLTPGPEIRRWARQRAAAFVRGQAQEQAYNRDASS